MHFHNVIMADYMERKGGQGSLLRKGVDLSEPQTVIKLQKSWTNKMVFYFLNEGLFEICQITSET